MFPKSVHLPDLATMSFEEAINASDFSGTSGEAPGLLFRHSSTPRRKHPALEVSTFVHGPGGVNIRSRALTGVETGAAEALRDAPAAILQKECTKTEIARCTYSGHRHTIVMALRPTESESALV